MLSQILLILTTLRLMAYSNDTRAQQPGLWHGRMKPHLAAPLTLRVAREKLGTLDTFRVAEPPALSASFAALTASSRLYLQSR